MPLGTQEWPFGTQACRHVAAIDPAGVAPALCQLIP
jgi:hypothetical protein